MGWFEMLNKFSTFFLDKIRRDNKDAVDFCKNNGFLMSDLFISFSDGYGYIPHNKVLQRYADALKLEKGSPDRDAFFALARENRAPTDSFGTFFFNKREKRSDEFCRDNDIAWSMLSYIQNNEFVPDGEDLRKYADMLDIKKGTNDWDTFFRLAAESLEQHPERATLSWHAELEIRMDKREEKYRKELENETD